MAQGRFIVTVLGKAGSGKTYLIRQILPALPRPVMILDTMNEFSDGLIFTEAEQLRRYIVERRPNATGVYVLKATSDEDANGFFRLVVASQAPMTVIIDEADKYATPYSIHDDLSKTIKYGRHWRQNLIFAARRPAELNRNVTAQSDVLVSFRQTEPRDIKALRDVYSDAERLSSLDAGRHEFMILGDGAEDLPFFYILRHMPIANDVPES